MRFAFEADGSVARQSLAPPFGFLAFVAVTGSSSFFRSDLRATGITPLHHDYGLC